MKKTIETIFLFILTIVAAVLIYKAFFAPKQQIIVKEKEIVRVEGKIKYVVKDKEVVKPYAIILDKIDGTWELDKDLSYLPDEMTVDTVSFEKKIDWKTPIRIGVSIDKEPVLCYNIANIRPIEVGPSITYDGDRFDFGVDIAARYRNVGVWAGYFILEKKVSFGILVKPF